MVDAPWALRGEAVVAWCGGRSIVVATRYVTSPVGPYLALGVARVGRIGLRPGLRFTTMVVDNHDRLTVGRRNWGFPGEIGTLTWATVGDESVLVWHERGIEVRGRAHGIAVSTHRARPLVAAPRRWTGRGADAHAAGAPASPESTSRFPTATRWPGSPASIEVW